MQVAAVAAVIPRNHHDGLSLFFCSKRAELRSCSFETSRSLRNLLYNHFVLLHLRNRFNEMAVLLSPLELGESGTAPC